MNIWPVIIFGGLATYLIRLSFIALMGRFTMPGWMQRALRFVPPAVFAVIIFQGLLFPNGSLSLSPVTNPRLVAGLIAALVAWRWRSPLLTIAVGMAALLVLQGLVL